MNYTEKILDAIKNSEIEKSDLNTDILNLDGMSSAKVRHLLNNLISEQDRYLEIGVWKGSTLISALYKNNPVDYLAIDNWSEFEAPRKDFIENFKKIIGTEPKLMDIDMMDIISDSLPKFNIYFYDGGHSEEMQYQALVHMNSCLDNNFILIIDDYNMQTAVDGTKRAIDDLKYNIIYETELPADYNGDYAKYWNGLYIANIIK